MKVLLHLAAGLCFALLACQQAPDYGNDGATADSTMSYTGSSSAAVENKNDTVHQFVRTADMKFRAGNVEKTTYQVEDIVNRHGGFVTFTQLNSNIDNSQTTIISEDSAVETIHFSVTNTMTLRVPNTALDTTLKDIARLVDYLDYRIIKADDVSQQMMANNLAQRRGVRSSERLVTDIAAQGRKLNDMTFAEEVRERKQADADEALMANSMLNEQIRFSTVQLSIYQRQGVKNEQVPNEKTTKAYAPNFGWQVLDSLQFGLELLENIFVGLLKLWPLFVLAIVSVAAYKRYGYKWKK
jgi:hypothetical protein